MKKTIIAAALVLSLAIVACDDGGDATAEPTAEAVATEAAEVTEAPAEDAEAPVEDAVESIAAEVEEVVDEAVESPAA